MNEQNTDIMKKAFPNVFRERFYFECGDGWFELLGKAAAFINSTTDKCYIVQAKEKFGTLRIYIANEYDEDGESLVDGEALSKIYDFINHLEKQSRNICEDCGVEIAMANRMNQKKMGYWIRNICKGCGEAYVKRQDRKTVITDKG